MSSIRQLRAQFRHQIREGYRFVVMGAVGFVITFGIASVLRPVGTYLAITIATVLSTVINYAGNHYWTFAHRRCPATARGPALFLVLNAVGLLVYYACIGVIDLAGLGRSAAWYSLALVAGTCVGALFRFWSYRKWVWLPQPEA